VVAAGATVAAAEVTVAAAEATVVAAEATVVAAEAGASAVADAAISTSIPVSGAAPIGAASAGIAGVGVPAPGIAACGVTAAERLAGETETMGRLWQQGPSLALRRRPSTAARRRGGGPADQHRDARIVRQEVGAGVGRVLRSPTLKFRPARVGYFGGCVR
jgi:hypothetical protein